MKTQKILAVVATVLITVVLLAIAWAAIAVLVQ
jgi:hypothetical protein